MKWSFFPFRWLAPPLLYTYYALTFYSIACMMRPSVMFLNYRTQRMNMVQTTSQLEFVYRTLSEAVFFRPDPKLRYTTLPQSSSEATYTDVSSSDPGYFYTLPRAVQVRN